jgi:hypothetical protein
MVAAALALAVLALGVFVGAPTAQTNPRVLEACRDGEASIDATDLPRLVEPGECPVRGRVIEDVGVGSVVPEKGEGVYAEALTTAGAQELEVTRLPDGTIELEHVGDDAGDVPALEPATGDVAAARAQGECSDDAYTNEDWRVSEEHGLGYGFNRTSTPGEIRADAAQGSIITAGTNITGVRNNCRLEDGVPAEMTYLGDTDSEANISRTNCEDPDGRSVVSFGDLAGSILAGTCTWRTRNPSGYDEVVESDVKINKANFQWAANPRARTCRDKYDLQSVMTHERGHTFGLDHVSEEAHGRLTMSTLIRDCQKSERTLGKGDVRGLNNKYKTP